MSEDPYLDPQTGVLFNKVGATTWEQLHAAEAGLTYVRAMELADQPIAGHFDLNHLRAIHRHLFQDVYPFAGEPRTVDMTKSGDPVPFFPAARLRQGAAYTFENLQGERHLRGLDRERFAGRLAHYLDEINHLHPFREGNGRTQRMFLSQLAGQAGYRIDWTNITAAQNNEASRSGEAALRTMLNGIVVPTQATGKRGVREAVAVATQGFGAWRGPDGGRAAGPGTNLDTPPGTRRPPSQQHGIDRGQAR